MPSLLKVLIIHTRIGSTILSLIPPWEDQREWHRMTRITGPDCAVMWNLINTVYIPGTYIIHNTVHTVRTFIVSEATSIYRFPNAFMTKPLPRVLYILINTGERTTEIFLGNREVFPVAWKERQLANCSEISAASKQICVDPSRWFQVRFRGSANGRPPTNLSRTTALTRVYCSYRGL